MTARTLYDMVTAPSGEGLSVKQEMTVQVEQWWNSSDLVSSLCLENTWGVDDTVPVNTNTRGGTRGWTMWTIVVVNVAS